MKTYRIPAYLDSFRGLVPCMATGLNNGNVAYRVTAARPGYERGAVGVASSFLIVPRRAVYRSRQACGQFRIRPYSWPALFAAEV